MVFAKVRRRAPGKGGRGEGKPSPLQRVLGYTSTEGRRILAYLWPLLDAKVLQKWSQGSKSSSKSRSKVGGRGNIKTRVKSIDPRSDVFRPFGCLEGVYPLPKVSPCGLKTRILARFAFSLRFREPPGPLWSRLPPLPPFARNLGLLL